MTDRSKSRLVDSYGAQYGNFDSELLAEVRREAFGEDIGQNGWLTASEQDMFIDWLSLSKKDHLLDIACGSGRPTIRIAEATGCRATGIDLHADAVSNATAYAKRRGLEDRTSFHVVNASEQLPFSRDKFDALICVDAINHLHDRILVLKEWHRVLKPGGRLLFTDPIIVTGPLTNHEIAIRASIGVFLFVPDGTDEQMLQMTGFSIERVADGTENMAHNARRRFDARARREAALREIEGGDAFDGQQVFFETAACLAEQRRLSRKAFLARKNS
jgi:ubiquinone/menaquinone biosynthesis C-methylase UbiE